MLTALATAISVVARLSANTDDTPLTDALAQSQNLDAGAIARLEASEKLAAIGAAKSAYATGGVARLAAGLLLLAAAFPLWRLARACQPAAGGAAASLLAVSGAATAVSGAIAIALAALAPETQPADMLRPIDGLASPAEETLLTLRWAAGALGFALAGLGLAALALAQWRAGSLLRGAAIIAAVLGVAMLFIWIDAATVVHRITGIGFLVWLIAAGLWLAAGRVRPGPQETPVPPS